MSFDRREERAERRTTHIAELRKRAAEADAKLKRLYDAIENGIADVSDPMLKERVTELKAIRDQARADAERAEGALDRAGPSITPQALKTFASQARRRMRTEIGRLSPRPPARAGPARRGGRERSSHHGVEKRTAAHARRRFERKNGRFWSAQFCTEVARPTGFELLTPTFGVWCSIQLSYGCVYRSTSPTDLRRSTELRTPSTEPLVTNTLPRLLVRASTCSFASLRSKLLTRCLRENSVRLVSVPIGV